MEKKKLAEMTIKEVNEDYQSLCSSTKDCQTCLYYGGFGCILDYIPDLRHTTLKEASDELGFTITEETTIKEIFLNLLERVVIEPEETEDYELGFDEDDNPLARMLHLHKMGGDN